MNKKDDNHLLHFKRYSIVKITFVCSINEFDWVNLRYIYRG